METFKNLLSLPVVKAAVDKVTDAYNKLKCSSSLVKDGVEKVECVVNEVKVSVSPITKELAGPVNALDKFVCRSLKFIEKRFPILKAQPEVMYGAFKNYIEDTVTPAIKTTLCVASGCKRILSPVTGFILVQTNRLAAVVDLIARSTEKIVDCFFGKKAEKCVPNGYEEFESQSSRSDVDDEPLPKVVETAETLGRVGFKLARAGFIIYTTPLRWTLSWFTCSKRAPAPTSSSQGTETVGSSSLTSGSSSSTASLETGRSASP